MEISANTSLLLSSASYEHQFIGSKSETPAGIYITLMSIYVHPQAFHC